MLEGKTAVVTGSTSGIGLAIARALAEAGANVVINGLGDKAEIETTRAAIEADFGHAAVYDPANMLAREEIVGMVRATEARFGAVDILVNNAGIQHVAPVDEFPDDMWDKIIAINLTATFHATKAVLPGMKKAGWGRIVNTASAHALIASPYKSAYVTAKHGVAGFTKTVALEVAQQNITANAICPGYVWTPMVEAQIPDTMKARGMTEEQVKTDVILAAQPTKKFVTVDQVAGFALFLCSDTAANITGAVLSMDGGWTAA